MYLLISRKKRTIMTNISNQNIRSLGVFCSEPLLICGAIPTMKIIHPLCIIHPSSCFWAVITFSKLSASEWKPVTLRWAPPGPFKAVPFSCVHISPSLLMHPPRPPSSRLIDVKINRHAHILPGSRGYSVTDTSPTSWSWWLSCVDLDGELELNECLMLTRLPFTLTTPVLSSCIYGAHHSLKQGRGVGFQAGPVNQLWSRRGKGTKHGSVLHPCHLGTGQTSCTKDGKIKVSQRLHYKRLLQD